MGFYDLKCIQNYTFLQKKIIGLPQPWHCQSILISEDNLLMWTFLNLYIIRER